MNYYSGTPFFVFMDEPPLNLSDDNEFSEKRGKFNQIIELTDQGSDARSSTIINKELHGKRNQKINKFNVNQKNNVIEMSDRYKKSGHYRDYQSHKSRQVPGRSLSTDKNTRRLLNNNERSRSPLKVRPVPTKSHCVADLINNSEFKSVEEFSYSENGLKKYVNRAVDIDSLTDICQDSPNDLKNGYRNEENKNLLKQKKKSANTVEEGAVTLNGSKKTFNNTSSYSRNHVENGLLAEVKIEKLGTNKIYTATRDKYQNRSLCKLKSSCALSHKKGDPSTDDNDNDNDCTKPIPNLTNNVRLKRNLDQDENKHSPLKRSTVTKIPIRIDKKLRTKSPLDVTENRKKPKLTSESYVVEKTEGEVSECLEKGQEEVVMKTMDFVKQSTSMKNMSGYNAGGVRQNSREKEKKTSVYPTDYSEQSKLNFWKKKLEKDGYNGNSTIDQIFNEAKEVREHRKREFAKYNSSDYKEPLQRPSQELLDIGITLMEKSLAQEDYSLSMCCDDGSPEEYYSSSRPSSNWAYSREMFHRNRPVHGRYF
ncbi:NKAP family protein-like [Prorops nasuta]|uniref:NKAP family protein-like n=1 Tax=Prorops nasuta TaxID=863751 RepID=UPI0034CD996F